MDARIHETDAPAELESGKTHGAIVAKDRVVGTGGFEPPTPSVSGKCSTTELRAFVANPGGRDRPRPRSGNKYPPTGQPRPPRATARGLSAKLCRQRRHDGSRTNRTYFLLRLPGPDGLRALPAAQPLPGADRVGDAARLHRPSGAPPTGSPHPQPHCRRAVDHRDPGAGDRGPHRVAFEQARARGHQGLAAASSFTRADSRRPAARRSIPTRSLRSRPGSSSRACASRTYATGWRRPVPT